MLLLIVHATRAEDGWDLKVPGFGHANSRSLADAEAAVRSLVRTSENLPNRAFEVSIRPEGE